MIASRVETSSFGALLTAFRHRRHLTQAHLAQCIGVHRHAIGRWEQGDVLPATKGLVLELARHLALDDAETRQFLEASLTALAPYWGVPLPRNPYFTGREKVLEGLHRQLGVRQGEARTHAVALQGLGGVGKTQLALEYAYRYALEYSAVFWIGAETDEQIVSSLLRIAEILQVAGNTGQDQQRVITAVQHWLSTHCQWLLIWDNVEDLTVLDRFLPPARQGVILFTTRLGALGTYARGLELAPMEPEEGRLFLLRRSKVLEPEATSEQVQQLAAQIPPQFAAAAELVTEMGGLPLALDQAGAYLEATHCGLPAYLELFRARRAALLQQRGDGAREHPASVATTFTLALATTEERHPAVGDLLRLCALLQPEAIPEELVRQGGKQLGTPLEVAGRDEVEWHRLVAVACSYSLLLRQPEEHTLSIHRLVQAVLWDGMTEAERARWNQRALAALEEAFPNVRATTDQTRWKQGERLLPHALLCLQRASTATPLVLASLAYKVAQYLRQCGRYAEAEPLYQRALHLREQVLGPAHPEVAAVLTSLGVLYRKQGRYAEAEPLLQRALPIWEHTVGPSHPDVAAALTSLAILYSEQGRSGEAEPLFHRALHIREQRLAPAHPDLASSLTNLGGLYLAQGKYAQAEPFLQRVVPLLEHALGPTHPELGTVLSNLALVYSKQGNYGKAEPLYQRALPLLEGALGPDHPEVARVLMILADLRRAQGRGAEAEVLYRRMLAIWEQKLGPDSPKLAEPLTGLADLCRTQGRYGEAEALYQRALSLWEQQFGPDHPGVAPMLTGLADLCRGQGREAEAEALYQRALRLREQAWGSAHPDVAETLYGLACFRQQQGKLHEARSLAERALVIRSQALGDAHPHTVATQTLYVQLLQDPACAEDESAVEGSTPPLSSGCSAEEAVVSLHALAALLPPEPDPVQAFLRACCELHPRAWSRSADLWRAYTGWAQDHQERFPLSRRAFGVQLQAHGCHTDRTKTARIWRGISLVHHAG